MMPDERLVYLDNHSTTPMDPRVVDAMLPYLTKHFGNSGSIGHSFGTTARKAVDTSRQRIAESLGVTPAEIVFTSGATESNNLAIRGIASRHLASPGHLVSVSTEHKAVLDPLSSLEKRGFRTTVLEPAQAPDANAGWLGDCLDQVAASIQEDTHLVSVMLANNEIGVVQPIAEIAKICHERGVLLHCDATQALGRMPLDLSELDVDMASFSGHKIYGPRGMGVLVVRRRRPRIRLSPQIEGGGQEQGRRSGTLNVPGIVGFAEALSLCDEELDTESVRIGEMREELYEELRERLEGVELNGPTFSHRLPGNLNLHFHGVDGEALMMNMQGLAVSSGSACTSANPEPSHVLRAIGLSEDATRSSLRFGIGRFNTDEDITDAVRIVVGAVERLRALQG